MLCALVQGRLVRGEVKFLVNSYETVFIINTQLDDDNIKQLVDKFKNLLETSAKLENIDEWGKRKLAYPINDQTEGYYVLADFSAESTFPQELERIYKISDGILKYLIIKKDN